MRIRYLKEGFFKNPEQARVAREKERELSNTEKIAGVSSKLIKEPLIKFINDAFDRYYHGRWRSASYTVGFLDFNRKDYFNVGPDFMSPYCIVKDKDVMYMNYTIGKTVVNDINFDEMTIDITTTIGTPIASRSAGSINPVSSNDFVAYASYYNKLYGIADVAGFERGNYSLKSPFAGTNKNLLMNKICYLFLTDLFNELKENPQSPRNEDEKNILEIVNALNFDHTKFKYNIKIEWNLQEDVIIFPVIIKDAADLNNSRNAEEEALEYMHQMFYPNIDGEFTECYKPYKERYGTDYITPYSLIKCMALLHGSTPSIEFTVNNIKKHVHSMEDLAALYAESLKNQDIEVTGPGHLYLSTGYFKKDYLIA